MDTETMLLIITAFALLLILGIIRVRRRVKADDEAIERHLAEVRSRRAEEQKRYLGTSADRRNRIDDFWRVPSDCPARAPSTHRTDVDEHAAEFVPALHNND